jgi:hypothetical protein
MHPNGQREEAGGDEEAPPFPFCKEQLGGNKEEDELLLHFKRMSCS